LSRLRGGLRSSSLHGCPTWTASVCTGSLILGAAGLALGLAARIAGEQGAQAIQLGIEYDPQPPFDAGSRDRAPAEVVALLRARSRFLTASVWEETGSRYGASGAPPVSGDGPAGGAGSIR
jgi:hypothetical protein